jgi:hypothetical protein
VKEAPRGTFHAFVFGLIRISGESNESPPTRKRH